MNTQCTQRETEIQHIIMKNQFNTLDDQSKYPDISRMHSKTVIMENSEYGNAKPVRFLSNVSYLVLNLLQPSSSLLSLLCKRQPPKCLPPGKSLSKLSRTKSLPRRRPLSLSCLSNFFLPTAQTFFFPQLKLPSSPSKKSLRSLPPLFPSLNSPKKNPNKSSTSPVWKAPSSLKATLSPLCRRRSSQQKRTSPAYPPTGVASW